MECRDILDVFWAIVMCVSFLILVIVGPFLLEIAIDAYNELDEKLTNWLNRFGN